MNWNSGDEKITSESRSLQLQFSNKISSPVLTGKNIEGDGGVPIKVALVDGLTGKEVNSGHEASAKVEIVLLPGDFDGVEGDDCPSEEFSKKIVREWKGKKSLLAGNKYLHLQGGSGVVNKISFTNTKNWMNIGKFRLGARVVDKFNGITVKAAKTEAFTVKDCRLEQNKKHYPPSLSDDVWRLEKIFKGGKYHYRLRVAEINSVENFLTEFYLDPQGLQDILKLKAASKTWEVMVHHAQTCIIDKEVYSYYSTTFEQKTGVVFNVVGQLLGLILECQYVPVDKLSETQKADARNSVVSAFENWGAVVTFDNETSLKSHLFNALNPLNVPRLESPSDYNVTTSETIDQYHTLPSVDDYEFLRCEDMEFLFDQGQNVIGQSSDFPRLESSSVHNVTTSETIDQYDNTQPSVDDFEFLRSEDMEFLFDQSQNAISQSSNFPRLESSSVHNVTTSETIDQYDHTQPSVDDFEFLRSEDMEFLFDQSQNAIGQNSDFPFINPESIIREFDEDLTHRRWKKLYSELKRSGSLIRRMGALEGVHVQKKQRSH